MPFSWQFPQRVIQECAVVVCIQPQQRKRQLRPQPLDGLHNQGLFADRQRQAFRPTRHDVGQQRMHKAAFCPGPTMRNQIDFQIARPQLFFPIGKRADGNQLAHTVRSGWSLLTPSTGLFSYPLQLTIDGRSTHSPKVGSAPRHPTANDRAVPWLPIARAATLSVACHKSGPTLPRARSRLPSQ